MKWAVLLLASLCAADAASGESAGSGITFLPAARATAGCRAVVADAAGKEHPFPCGSRVEAPAGEVWLEQDGMISPSRQTVHGTEMKLPLVAAGSVAIDVPEEPLGEGIRLRLISLEHAFTRDVEPGVAAAMPAGRSLAIALDRRGNAVAVTKPFASTPGAPRRVRLARPEAGADLVAFLTLPPDTAEAPRLSATDGTSVLAPEVAISSASTLTVIWYGLELRRARITAESDAVLLEPEEISLRARNVTTFQAALRPLPRLAVTISGDAAVLARDEVREAAVRVLRDPAGTVVRESVGGAGMTFERMQPEIYRVVLRIGDWELERRVDLSAGEDASAEFALEPLTISGRVTYGGEPAAASVGVRSGRKLVAATTDEEGAYELVLWRGGRYQMEVTLTAQADAPAYLELIRVTSDQVVDVDLPRTSYVLRVTDGKSGAPIAGARLTLLSTWEDPRQGKRRTGRDVATGQDGTVPLPPMHTGMLELHARADGYLEADEMTVAITESGPAEAARVIDVRLQPSGEAARLQILLPTGAPASDAELIAVDTRENALWRDRAGRDGSITVPRSVAGAILVIRHPGAASSARPWQPDGPATIALLPAAPQPLVLRVEGRSGRPAAATAVLAWIDGRWVGGSVLAFATWSSPATDGDGIWSGRNLPAAPARVIAAGPRATAAIHTGAFDSVASVIAYPWPVVQQITSVE